MPVDALRRFEAVELRRFLTAVDANLDHPVRMLLVGGSAMALAYGVDTGTRDVDTFQTDLRDLARAIALARAATGLDIPVESADVGDLPWDYESRLRRELPELSRLRVHVPEKHDLALSKIVRGQEGDLTAIERLHRLQGLEQETLVSRYFAEMNQAIGDPQRLDTNLVLAIERLFGEMDAEAARKKIVSRRQRLA